MSPHPTHGQSRPAPQSPDLAPAIARVRSSDGRAPSVALILGSGLGSVADELAESVHIPAWDIPGYPASSVSGHSGELVIGVLEGRVVAVVKGRVHCYEGHDPYTVAFPVRLVHALGARRLIVTNAAGGIDRNLSTGSIMLIVDHLNATFQPLGGGSVPGGGAERGALAGKGSPYDAAWIDEAESVAVDLGLRTRRGVYVWTLGPSYETKAEIRYFERAGADAVGMSTVPEVEQARRLGMKVLGVSTITNRAAGLEGAPLSHDDVLRVGALARVSLGGLVRELVRRLPED